MSGDEYEVYALRYFTLPGLKSSVYYRFDLYDEEDLPCDMDYFFWLIRNDERVVLLDCGFSAESSLEKRRPYRAEPLELLASLDVQASEVDHVVLSHMHFDHVGNTHLFPNATFTMARSEFEFWTGPYADRTAFSFTIQGQDIRSIKGIADEGRLRLVEDSGLLFPGISVTRFPGHTPGQLITEVATSSGQLILASDAAHFYEQVTLDRPFTAYFDIEGVFRTLARLREFAMRPGYQVIPGHDPAVMSRYKLRHGNCADLTSRLE
jgi:glyoxylase-like metal-dependent hydrolase (beta-lactamase superfamily II)